MKKQTGGAKRSLDWLDRREYPFESHYFEGPGGRLHYVDEGEGDPIVFVHGTATWSFMFRRLIRDLSGKHRCIAVDHIGFGLSDKPKQFSYSPEAHARNLTRLLDHLDLKNITLVVHDFGGPIGLSYAIENPRRVNRLVLMNTWMWSLKADKHVNRIYWRANGPMGRIEYIYGNHSVRSLANEIKQPQKLPAKTYEQYKHPLERAGERFGTWGFARSLIGSNEMFYGLWARREVLETKQALILWGMHDPILGTNGLERWKQLLPKATVETFPESGSLICEEQANEVDAAIFLFLDGNRELLSTAQAINQID